MTLLSAVATGLNALVRRDRKSSFPSAPLSAGRLAALLVLLNGA